MGEGFRSVVSAKIKKEVFRLMGKEVAEAYFHADTYLRHTARRLEHLASLRIPVAGMSVLEVGAGIGDLSHYFLDRNCRLVITEARAANIKVLRERYPDVDVRVLDMENPILPPDIPFDVVHCYGLLYHLSRPERALEFLARCCARMLFLETCVSFGDTEELDLVTEERVNPTQSFTGKGCRPTREWVAARLKEHFAYVYVPLTQPCHKEFPLDWTDPAPPHDPLARAVFIASRNELKNDRLVSCLLKHQLAQE